MTCNSNRRAPRQQQDDGISAKTHCGLDSMSNIPCMPEETARKLHMVMKEPEREMRFGSYSHDGTIQIQHVATFTDSRYLPSFAVTTTGTMPILPTFWLSQMGYSVTILPYERGFHIVDSQTQDAVYKGSQHTDKFLYLPTMGLSTKATPNKRK